MTLAFRQQLNDKPTFFVEKITEGIRNMTGNFLDRKYLIPGMENENPLRGEVVSKIHTIRQDASNRWKAGNKIHFVINNRTPKRFQFAPVIYCTGIQKIVIIYARGSRSRRWVVVDDSLQTEQELITLARNDGFESVDDFFAYFSEDFEGKIIHWTGFRYE